MADGKLQSNLDRSKQKWSLEQGGLYIKGQSELKKKLQWEK